MKEPTPDYPRAAYFAALLTGSDNTKDYTYLGMVNPGTGELRLTRGSKLETNSAPVALLRQVIAATWASQPLPPGHTLHHEGRCGKCGRPLTTPESVKRGIGPECFKRM